MVPPRAPSGAGYGFWMTLCLIFAIPAQLFATPPSAVVLDGTNVREQQPVGTIVGIIKAIDADAADSHTFSLVAGEGGEDNALFTIDGDLLRTAGTFDYATRNGFRIRIRAQDASFGAIENPFIITVTHPKFTAAVEAYFEANAGVRAASVAALSGDTLDYFWVYLHLQAATGRIPMDAPANLPADPNLAGAATVSLSMTEVTRIHAAKVAHAIWIDLNRLVPWRLSDYEPEHLAGLFDAGTLFDVRSPGRLYYVIDYSPSEVWHYAIGHSLLRQDIQRTVEAVIDDMRSDFIHGASSYDPQTAISLRAVLEDYRVRSTIPHRVARIGCHSSSRIFLGLLRCMNIPGYQTTQGEYFITGHSTAVVPCIGRTLAHGDDIYSGGNRAVPASELLVPFHFYADTATTPPAFGDRGDLAVRYHALLTTQYPTNTILNGVRNPPSNYGGTAVRVSHRLCRLGPGGSPRPRSMMRSSTLLNDYNETRTLAVPNSLPGGHVANSPTGSSYPLGGGVSLKAIPTVGNLFSHWSGDLPADGGTANPLILSMDADRSITPHFLQHSGSGGGAAPLSIEARTLTFLYPGGGFRETFGPGGAGGRQSFDGMLNTTAYSFESSGDMANLTISAGNWSETITLDYGSSEGGELEYRLLQDGVQVSEDTGTFLTDGRELVMIFGTENLVPIPEMELSRPLPLTTVGSLGLVYGRAYKVERSTDLLNWDEIYRFTADSAAANWSEVFGDARAFYRVGVER